MQERFKYLKTSAGTSLVELVVTLGMTSLLTLGTMTIMTAATKTQKAITSAGNIDNAVYLTQLNLGSSCTSILANGQNSLNPSANGVSTVTMNYNIPVSGASVSAIHLQTLSLVATPNIYSANLEIIFTKNPTGAPVQGFGENTLTKAIALEVTTNAPSSNVITGCAISGATTQPPQWCAWMGGNYNSGANPPCKFTLASHNILQFANPGTTRWTVPNGITRVYVKVVGGGGGGGGSTPEKTGGGGGAAGYCEALVPVLPGQVIPITVGAGGSGGPYISSDPNGTANCSGSAGGTSSFDNYCTAAGGGGGGDVAGGAGGSASFASGIQGIAFSGGYGQDGHGTGPGQGPLAILGGMGAASIYGGAGRAGSVHGNPGISPGAGGAAPYEAPSGPAQTGLGGSGANGVVFVQY